MRTRMDGVIVWEYEECPEELVTDTDSVRRAKVQLETEGWRSYDRWGQFRPLCPGCRENVPALTGRSTQAEDDDA